MSQREESENELPQLVKEVDRDNHMNIVHLECGVAAVFYDPGPQTDWPRAVFNIRKRWANETAAAGKDEMTEDFLNVLDGGEMGELDQTEAEIPAVSACVCEFNMRANELRGEAA